MSNYKPKKGDTVRVVLEGEVTNVYATDGSFEVGRGPYANSIGPDEAHTISVEQIKPPLQIGWHRVIRDGVAVVESLYWTGKGWRYNESPDSDSDFGWESVGYLGTGVTA